MKAFSRLLNVIAVALSLWAVRAVAQPKPQATLIRDALVIDGRGTPGVSRDVRVMGDRITAVGQLTPQAGDRVIDARCEGDGQSGHHDDRGGAGGRRHESAGHGVIREAVPGAKYEWRATARMERLLRVEMQAERSASPPV